MGSVWSHNTSQKHYARDRDEGLDCFDLPCEEALSFAASSCFILRLSEASISLRTLATEVREFVDTLSRSLAGFLAGDGAARCLARDPALLLTGLTAFLTSMYWAA